MTIEILQMIRFGLSDGYLGQGSAIVSNENNPHSSLFSKTEEPDYENEISKIH